MHVALQTLFLIGLLSAPHPPVKVAQNEGTTSTQGGPPKITKICDDVILALFYSPQCFLNL